MEMRHINKPRHSIAVTGDSSGGRRLSSFLHLNIPETNWRGSLTHLHLPTFNITSADGDHTRKFNFNLGIRRHSHNTLPRTESMVSLCFRSLATYINDNNFDGFQSFLESKQIQVDDRDENCSTALILASSKGRANFVRELLAHGADTNAEDGDNWAALLCAAKEGHADICLQLLEHNAEIEHRDMGGWTALMWATYKGRTEVVKLLLERRADVNAHGNYHISSLLWASGRGYVQIVEGLIRNGAKVNMGDKYGTTALIWASRKGHTDIVRLLLRAGANVDTAGMYSWTALLVATQGNFEEIVHSLLEHKPNVNALDKDGCSALTIACKEGFYEIATALMNVGAYINIQDRGGDTNLIHAVKGGHRAVVEALLKKYADVDITGKDRKTAIYMAVEKGYVAIVKLLLNSNADLEIATKDGDTPLLKAVRSRNCEIVQLLLDKKAKVTAADKKGDTALHIAMRARSKAIVEILLRNPKHSHLLYRPNRSGETPYNIDMNHQKTILGQIFGARRLNTNEDNENMLGYDLYSSALADILSEPCLSMPITVGLYAKWGSGKSFLLNKLREEMKNFAKQWVDPVFQFTFLLFVLILHLALIIGTILGLSLGNWVLGVVFLIGVIAACYFFLALVWFAGKKYDWDWPYNFHVKLTRKLNRIKLILQMLFCHPPGASLQDVTSAQPIRFYFTDQTRVSSSTGGENSIVQMIGSLYDAIESEHGAISTRLYRAFKPKPVKSSTSWKWRKICCLPTIVIFEITFIFLLIGTCALTVFLVRINSNAYDNSNEIEKLTLHVILITVAVLLGVATLANLYTWTKMFGSLFFSQRSHLRRTIAKLDTLKSEGFIQALKQEVNLMKEMVTCLDTLTSQQTRLVIVVDGLDSCEQDKVLLVLDAVHMLFSDVNSPFIVILAIDPHVIAKAVEMNSRRLFSESNIGGHSYLNNMVHLPFYLQNSGLRKVKLAQQTASAHRKINYPSTSNEDSLSVTGRTLSARRLSSENALTASTEKLKFPSSRKGSRKLKLSESIASSIGSNLNRIGGAQDLTKMLLTDDYFSDVNPKSMRRLMNVVYITGRLLKAFQIEFNWYRLASWINITEQWPFRTSWIIYRYDLYENSLDDNTSLKTLFDEVRPHIPSLKETEPLLELDRDERKFDIFLTFHRSSLLVSDLKIFLPFTINLDPYLKKVIKEETQTLDDGGLFMTPSQRAVSATGTLSTPWSNAPSEWNTPRIPPNNRRLRSFSTAGPPTVVYPQTNVMGWRTWGEPIPMTPAQSQYHLAPVTTLSPEIFETKLSALNVDGVCKLMEKLDDLKTQSLQDYTKIIKQNNINGRVLLHCDLDELKKLLKMTFGDWEMFKVMIVSLREHELTTLIKQDEARNVRFSVTSQQSGPKPERKLSITKSNVTIDIGDGKEKTKQSVMEKQVTLEDQMICGALQTLNEEACEDVLEETEETIPEFDNDVPITFIVPPSPEAQQETIRESRSRTNSSSGLGETDFVLLQSSPMRNMHWQPVGISVQGNTECISENNSRTNSPMPSPSFERRRSNSIKLSNLRNTDYTDCGQKRVKHVVINTDNKSNLPTTTILEAKPSNKTPLLQDYKNVSCQTTTKRPVSLYLKHDQKSNKYSTKIRSHSIDNTVHKKYPSLEKLHRLKERFLQSNPDVKDNQTDDESTPLVSDISSPTTLSPDEKSSHSLSSSDPPFSPSVKKPKKLDKQKQINLRQRRFSEQNMINVKDIVSNLGQTQQNDSDSPSIDIPLSSPRTISESTDGSVSLNNKLLSASNISLHSKGSQSSGHLSRQDALESDENLTDVYCDPGKKT